MAILIRPLRDLREQADERWPGRPRGSDGWIGDLDHQERRSGHNPDESGNPERTDADSIDEVRAVDLTRLHPGAGVTMLAFVLHIVARMTALGMWGYVIWDRRICSIGTGRWEPYSGTNPHTLHAHVSVYPEGGWDDRAVDWELHKLGVTDMALKNEPLESDPKLSCLRALDDVSTSLRLGHSGVGGATDKHWINAILEAILERVTHPPVQIIIRDEQLPQLADLLAARLVPGQKAAAAAGVREVLGAVVAELGAELGAAP